MPSWVKKPLRVGALLEEKKSMRRPAPGDCCSEAARMELERLGMEMRTKSNERWKWERSVVVKKDSNLRRPMEGSLVHLETPRSKSWRV